MIVKDKCLHDQLRKKAKKMGGNQKNIFITEPTHLARFLLDTHLRASKLTPNSLHSELLHSKNLETCEPTGYFTNHNFALLRATALYKHREI